MVIPDFLLGLQAVALARISDDGVLIEANAGFLKRLPPSLPDDAPINVRPFFIQPSFSQLTAQTSQATGRPYEGLLTIGEPAGDACSLHGKFFFEDNEWALVAEHNIEEFETVRQLLLDLNRELAQSQRDLVQARHNLALSNKLLLLQNKQLQELSLTDQLTGLGNRRRFDESLTMATERARRKGTPLSLIMMDIDRFKHINDEFGHDMGDRVLEALGKLLPQQIRISDRAVRIGGEEFVIIMPVTTVAEATHIAERIRLAVSQLQIEGLTCGLSASFGVAELYPSESAKALLERSDTAMYSAKKQGRDRVVTDFAKGGYKKGV